MEKQHTLGPWTQGYGTLKCAIYDSNFRAVAQTMNDNKEANACLIAAAPELLEALNEVLATGLNGGNNVRLALMAASQTHLSDASLERAEKAEAALQKAYSAIKKATQP